MRLIVNIFIINFLGVREFPGDFDRPPHILTNVQYHIESKANEWYCTGEKELIYIYKERKSK